MSVPRRCRIDLLTKEEKAIYDCIQMVEDLGADTILTDVVVKLGEAKDRLSDYVDQPKADA